MKKLLIKLVAVVIIIFSFTGCYALSKKYSYKVNPSDNSSNFSKYMGIYGALTDSYDKDSPIESVSIYPINFSNKKTSEKVELLSNKIKVVYKGKEYYLKTAKNKRSILPYEEGIILKEGAIVYFGKVKVDDKMIIEIPPIRLKKFVHVTSYNPIADGLNIDTTKDVYEGPLDEYKGR